MPTQKRRDRISQILEILQLTRGATIRELSRRFDVSEMTIRRDLEVLADDRKVRLVHAGAIPAEGLSDEGLFLRAPTGESTPDAEERMRIGRKAATLVEPGDIAIIDAGTTTEWLTRSLPADLPVTILCFALNILIAAGQGPGRTVVFAGGSLRHETLVFESPEGVSLIRRYRANKAFLSAGGVDAALGLTCTDPSEAELKKAAVASSQTRILLCDSRKFGTVKPAWFADLKDLDAIVTDQGVSLEYVEILRELGIALHVV